MKKAVFIVLQALLLLAAYFAGTFLQALHKIPTWSMPIHNGRSVFFWDGLVFLLAVFVLILVVQAVRKVIGNQWGNPLVALVLTLLFLLATKFPMSTYTPTPFTGM